MIKNTRLAKRYATAFLNIFMSELSSDVIKQLDELINFFKNHHEALLYTKLSGINSAVKEHAFIKLLERYGLVGKPYKRLINLIAQDKRLFLLQEIVEQIRAEYLERNNILECTIKSASLLSSSQQQCIENFLTESLHKTIHPHYRNDTSLIAGIRVESGTWLWEHSVRQYLAALKKSL